MNVTEFELPARDYAAKYNQSFQAGTVYAAYMAGVKAVIAALETRATEGDKHVRD